MTIAGTAQPADAAWVAVKNDTNQIIVIQTSITVNGQVKRGKPIRLLPGEVAREFIVPQVLGLEVYDAQLPNKAVLNSSLTIKNENQAFSVSAGPAGTMVSPVTGK